VLFLILRAGGSPGLDARPQGAAGRGPTAVGVLQCRR